MSIFWYRFTSKYFSNDWTLLSRGKTRSKLPMRDASSSKSRSISISSGVSTSFPVKDYLYFSSSSVIDCLKLSNVFSAVDALLNSSLSYPLIPTRVRASHINMVLILLSNIDELDRLGRTLTSKTHGFRFSSIMTSNPQSSKQLLRNVGYFARLELMVGSTEIKVFSTISWISTIVLLQSRPNFSKDASSCLKSHFDDSVS